MLLTLFAFVVALGLLEHGLRKLGVEAAHDVLPGASELEERAVVQVDHGESGLGVASGGDGGLGGEAQLVEQADESGGSESGSHGS